MKVAEIHTKKGVMKIKFFEKELSFEYEVPDNIIDETKEKETVETNTADNVDVNKL